MSTQDQRYLNAVTYNPSWRAQEARCSDEPSSDPYVLRYRAFLKTPKDNTDFSLQVAHDIFRTDWFRCEVEAYIMANADHAEIAERYDVSPEAIEVYATLFFDITPLRGDGSRKRVANDLQVPSTIRKARQFGHRYGKLFLDWYSSKIKALLPAEIEELDSAFVSLLGIKLINMDALQLSDKEQMNTGIHLMDAYIRYRQAMNKSEDGKEVNLVLSNLQALVRTSASPQGLPSDIFQARTAKPKADPE